MEKEKKFIEDSRIGIERFLKENNRYPLSVDFDSCEYLPTSRTIQRKIGGVSKLREIIGLEITDYTKGKTRADKSRACVVKSEETQNEIYEILVKKFGKMSVHRESPYGDNSKERSDFEVYHKKGIFYIDAFHPSSKQSFFSCLNFKIKRYNNPKVFRDVIFLNTNENIGCDISTKKIKLKKKQKVMNVKEFMVYIESLRQIEIK